MPRSGNRQKLVSPRKYTMSKTVTYSAKPPPPPKPPSPVYRETRNENRQSYEDTLTQSGFWSGVLLGWLL